MKIKSHIRSVQLIFSIFIFLIFAGLTGCKDDGAEFLEKELVQEDLKDEFRAGSNSDWATDSQDELEDWIEEQGIQLRY